MSESDARQLDACLEDYKRLYVEGRISLAGFCWYVDTAYKVLAGIPRSMSEVDTPIT